MEFKKNYSGSSHTYHLTPITREGKKRVNTGLRLMRSLSVKGQVDDISLNERTKDQSPGPGYRHMPIIDADLINPLLSPIAETMGINLAPQRATTPQPNRVEDEDSTMDRTSTRRGKKKSKQENTSSSRATNLIDDDITSRNLTRPHRVSGPPNTRAQRKKLHTENPVICPHPGKLLDDISPPHRPRLRPLLPRPPLRPTPLHHQTPLPTERRTPPSQRKSQQRVCRSAEEKFQSMLLNPTRTRCVPPRTSNSSIESSEYAPRTPADHSNRTGYHHERHIRRSPYPSYMPKSTPYCLRSHSSSRPRENVERRQSASRSYNSPPYRSLSIAPSLVHHGWKNTHRPVLASTYGERRIRNQSAPDAYRSPHYRSRPSLSRNGSQVVEKPMSSDEPAPKQSRVETRMTYAKPAKSTELSSSSSSSSSSSNSRSKKLLDRPSDHADISLLATEEPFPPSAQSPLTTSSVRATKIPITLRTQWYSPFLLLKANANDTSPHPHQDRLFETMIVERNGGKLTSWRTSQTPSYFTRVEDDAGLRSKASRTSTSLFHRFAAEHGIVEPLKILLEKSEKLHKEATDAVCRALTPPSRRTSVGRQEELVGWWPVGNNGTAGRSRTCLDTAVLGVMTRDAMNNNVKWNGISKSSAKKRETQCISTLQEMVAVFNLKDCAARRVLSGERSLLAEVSRQCTCWERERKNLQIPRDVPSGYTESTKIISPDELYYECKFGVYFVPGRNSVFKFLTQQTLYPEFIWEAALGLSVAPIKGMVPIKNVCPEAFCFEMEFVGLNLDDVINGDTNGLQRCRPPPENPPVLQHCLKMTPKITCLYAVRMMAARGDFRQSCDPSLSERIATVYDTYHAAQIAGIVREKLLRDLPFAMAEMVNIVTRLSQQGIVNPDIKCDNFVVDPQTAQPFMIDFGLVIPEGSTSKTRFICEPGQYPQSPKEYLSGKQCTTDAMTFGLAFTFMDMLNTLLLRTGNPGAVAIYYNIEFLEWMSSAYSDIPRERPSVVEVATIIGRCFPLPPKVSDLFAHPRQTLY
nr:MAG: wsv423-like protein [Marsupenaeus japonicus pemonivirus]